jgi:hypothetical protein
MTKHNLNFFSLAKKGTDPFSCIGMTAALLLYGSGLTTAMANALAPMLNQDSIDLTA